MPRRREGRDLPEIVSKLFEQVRAEFPDPFAVNRTLVQLSRLYDPVSGGPLLRHELRRQIVESLERGAVDEARAALEARFEEYRSTFRLEERES